MAPPKKPETLQINAYWEYAKWWHKIIRRKTVYFSIEGYPTISFNGKAWSASSVKIDLSKPTEWKYQEKKK